MDIERVAIERRDGDSFCGVLTYSHHMRRQLLTWSFDVDETRKVVLLLYPANSATAYPEVQDHYAALADAILGEIYRELGPQAEEPPKGAAE